MSEEKTESKLPPFLVVTRKGDDTQRIEASAPDLRSAKKTAVTEAPKFAAPGDKVAVYELRWSSNGRRWLRRFGPRRWSSTAKPGDLVLEADPEPKPEPKAEPSNPQAAVSA